MIKDFLKTVNNEAALWHLLSDISEIMTDRQYKHKGQGIIEADNFWLACAGEIKEEIDRRLFLNYDNGFEPDPDEDEEEDF